MIPQSPKEFIAEDATHWQREAFIPLHPNDLMDFLVKHPALNRSAEYCEPATLGHFHNLLSALLHQRNRNDRERLTYDYASLDPDRDFRLPKSAFEDINERLARMSDGIAELLCQANYSRMNKDQIQQAIGAASFWGVRLKVDFTLFYQLEVYSRGDVIGHKQRRHWSTFFKPVDVEVPIYQRLVVVFRLHPDRTLEDLSAPDQLHLRMFKNIPKADVDMLLPGSAVRMSWLDHGKMALPSLYGLGMLGWKIIRGTMLIALAGIFKTFAAVILIALALTYAVKYVFNYTNTKRRYLLSMAQSLYYQKLDNNLGVLVRLQEEAEQQQIAEAMLGFFVLAVIARDQAWTAKQIDQAAESLLLAACNVEIDFDVDDSLAELESLGLVRKSGDRWTACSLARGVEILDHAWDALFQVSRMGNRIQVVSPNQELIPAPE